MAETISITLCGDGGCGKSSITLRLVRSQWTHEYDPTIEDNYSVTRTVDGLPYHLSLIDTAGQEEYRSLWGGSHLSSDAFLLVYDITNPSSLETLSHYVEMIDLEAENRIEENSRLLKGDGGIWGEEEKKLIKSMPVKIVAGNKCDLREERRLTAQQGLDWARRRGCGFMETSARGTVNIEETFALIVRRVVEARRQALLNPCNPSPFKPSSESNAHSTIPATESRTSIMNLTRKNALQAAAGQPGDQRATHITMAPTPPLARAGTAGRDAEKVAPTLRKGESTRLDGGRKKSVLGRGAGALGRLRCWRRSRW